MMGGYTELLKRGGGRPKRDAGLRKFIRDAQQRDCTLAQAILAVADMNSCCDRRDALQLDCSLAHVPLAQVGCPLAQTTLAQVGGKRQQQVHSRRSAI